MLLKADQLRCILMTHASNQLEILLKCLTLLALFFFLPVTGVIFLRCNAFKKINKNLNNPGEKVQLVIIVIFLQHLNANDENVFIFGIAINQR